MSKQKLTYWFKANKHNPVRKGWYDFYDGLWKEEKRAWWSGYVWLWGPETYFPIGSHENDKWRGILKE